MHGNERFRIAGASVIALISLSVLAMTSENRSAPKSFTAQEKTVDEDTVDIVRLLGNARIEIGLSSSYVTKSPTVEAVRKLTEIVSPSSAEFYFGLNGKLEGMPNLSKSGVYRAVVESRSQGLPGGVSLACKEEQKHVLEAKVVGGRVDRTKKPPLLATIELDVKSFVAENKKTCQVSPPGVTLPTETVHDDGHKADWWRMVLYNWPLKEGHSEVVGRFQYTLHINYRSECDEQLRRSMDELRDRFDKWVENCVYKSGVVTQCDADMLRRCMLSIYGGDQDTSIVESCIETACGVWEEGLIQCMREIMSTYFSHLITIEKQYKECMGKQKLPFPDIKP